LSRTAPPLSRATRWEALATVAPLLFHPTTRAWRCGRCLLLQHAWVTPPRPPQATTTNALTSESSAHMNPASRFQLFSIIIKCIRSFSDSMVRKQIGFRRGPEEGRGSKEGGGGGPEEGDGGGVDVR
jgi:hypothetical protein